MTSFRWHAVWVLAAWLAVASSAQAQQSFTPHIGYVYPAGGKQGTTFEVILGGQSLDGVTGAHVSGYGVTATLVDYVKPISAGQATMLRDKLKELFEKKQAAAAAAAPSKNSIRSVAQSTTKPAWTAEDDKAIEDIKKKLATFIRTPSSPAIVETVTLQITVSPDAELGSREIRLSVPSGLTNPLTFNVGQLPEFSKKATKPTDAPRVVKESKFFFTPKAPITPSEMNVTLPTVINGQIAPGGVDRYRFSARKGQHLVIAASARELIPYIPDAVPGWVQATLTLHNATGSEVAYADHFLFHNDPVIYYEVPADGEYVVEMHDAIYRGREDFVYRITLGEVPYITSIFPLGGKAGTQINVQLQGWNLPATSVPINVTDRGIHIRTIGAGKGELSSNRMPFATDNLPECTKKGPINSPATAMAVTLPIIVNGRIETPGEPDVFRFEGKAGQRIVAEVFARRLDSPMDSELTLTDAAGKQLAFNDDFEDKGSGLNTHHADSYISANLPADGTYYIYLADTQRKAGPEYAYRLRISPPHPDFELRVVPSCISVRGGGTVPITVYALRKDGFTGDITLSLKDAPAGFALSGACVPGKADQVRLTLSAPPTATAEPINLTMEGRSAIQGHEIVHQAVPAEDMMQAFAYRHLVPAKDFKVFVTGKFTSKAAVKLLSETPVKLPLNGTGRVVVGMPTKTLFMGTIHLELSDPPDGITLKSTGPYKEGTELIIACDPAKIKAGLRGNLIILAYAEKAPSADAKAKTNRPRLPIGALPAVPFEVTAK